MLMAALAYITAGSNQNSASAVLSTRAYYAAQSGAEWETYQISPSTGFAASTCFTPNPFPSTSQDSPVWRRRELQIIDPCPYGYRYQFPDGQRGNLHGGGV